MKINADGQIKTNAEALASKLSAKKMRLNVESNAKRNPELAKTDLIIAEKLERSADEYLMLEKPPERGMAGELIPSDAIPSIVTSALKSPSRVNLDASINRAELADKNGVLNMALDTAESIGAKNAAEQMLAHQMAAAHRISFDLLAESSNTRDPIEKCRLINTSAKLMDVLQKAMLTIHKLHSGGQQTVTVQHVQVTEGGQAVINGAVHTGGPISEQGEGSKK